MTSNHELTDLAMPPRLGEAAARWTRRAAVALLALAIGSATQGCGGASGGGADQGADGGSGTDPGVTGSTPSSPAGGNTLTPEEQQILASCPANMIESFAPGRVWCDSPTCTMTIRADGSDPVMVPCTVAANTDGTKVHLEIGSIFSVGDTVSGFFEVDADGTSVLQGTAFDAARQNADGSDQVFASAYVYGSARSFDAHCGDDRRGTATVVIGPTFLVGMAGSVEIFHVHGSASAALIECGVDPSESGSAEVAVTF